MIELSIVIPAKNESGNIAPLVNEMLSAFPEQSKLELIFVDDGSVDDTYAAVKKLQDLGHDFIKVIQHAKSVGQSTAIYSGILASSGRLVATLDADGQNDPADLHVMLEKTQAFTATQHFCITGYRKNRKDTRWKRWQSLIANKIRRAILDDGSPDTGCGIKVFPRHTFMLLPYFDHMHRFMPALIRRLGGDIVVVSVNHRARLCGQSNYTMWNRLWVSIVDILGVLWLQNRMKHVEIVSHESSPQ